MTDQKAYELYAVKNGKVDYLCGRGEPCEGFSFSFGEGGIPVPATDVVRNEWTEAMQKWAEVFKALPEGGNRPSGYQNHELWRKYQEIYASCEATCKDKVKQAVEIGVLVKKGKNKGARYWSAFPITPIQEVDDEL